jgi:hypothetical protein
MERRRTIAYGGGRCVQIDENMGGESEINKPDET